MFQKVSQKHGRFQGRPFLCGSDSRFRFRLFAHQVRVEAAGSTLLLLCAGLLLQAEQHLWLQLQLKLFDLELELAVSAVALSLIIVAVG